MQFYMLQMMAKSDKINVPKNIYVYVESFTRSDRIKYVVYL